MMDRENDIRLIAYHVWEEEGCPAGRDCEHWAQAELIWETGNNEKTGTAASTKSAVKTAKKKVSTAKKSAKK